MHKAQRGHKLSVVRKVVTGSQLSVVRKKLNVVADRGRRKLSVVTDRTPEKGRQYSISTHTEHALVATICL
jgi:hypothetical protein